MLGSVLTLCLARASHLLRAPSTPVFSFASNRSETHRTSSARLSNIVRHLPCVSREFCAECLASNGFVRAPGEGHHRGMVPPLQRSASAFEHRLSHAKRIRGSSSKTSAPQAMGWDAAVDGAPRRPVAEPPRRGTTAASEGSPLKLTVFQGIRADQVPFWGENEEIRIL